MMTLKDVIKRQSILNCLDNFFMTLKTYKIDKNFENNYKTIITNEYQYRSAMFT